MPTLRRASAVAAFIVATAVVASTGFVPAYSSPAIHVTTTPLAHTGGFGEPTCLTCHLEFELNPDGGLLRLAGVPERFESGISYVLRIELEGEGMLRGGFQAAARFADGSQAGVLRATDSRVIVSDSAGVQYGRHSSVGVAVTSPDRIEWSMTWIAPQRRGVVEFHVAANSANGDDSPLGDWVLTIQERSRPAQR